MTFTKEFALICMCWNAWFSMASGLQVPLDDTWMHYHRQLNTLVPSPAATLNPSSQPTKAAHLTPPTMASMVPAVSEISPYPSKLLEETQRPSLFSARPSSSDKPTHYPSSLPTITSYPSATKSGAPSTTSLPSAIPSSTATEVPSAIPTFSHSAHPTATESSSPSREISDRPTTLPSVQPSKVISFQPSIQPSTVRSAKPTKYIDTLVNSTFVVTLYAKALLNTKEIEAFQTIAKETLISEDKTLDIHSVVIVSQEMVSDRSRRVELSQSEDTYSSLEMSGFVLGLMPSLSSSALVSKIFPLRIDKVLTSEILRSRLAKLMPVFQKDLQDTTEDDDDQIDCNDATECNRDIERKQSSGLLIARIGAGVGAVGVLVIAAFIVHGRLQRKFDRAQLSDNRSDKNTDGMNVLETDPKTKSQPSPDIQNNEKQDVSEERDRFSNLSYSESSSEFIQDQDFSWSLTTKNSSHDDQNDTGFRLREDDFPDFPLQQLKAMPSTIQENSSHHSHGDSSVISNVQTEIFQQHNKGVGRMFACFDRTSKSLSGAASERTPRISNVMSQSAFQMDHHPSYTSAVSSLSGKSSYSGSVSLAGEPYEVVVPSSKPLGLVVSSTKSGPQVLRVKRESPLRYLVHKGDYVQSVDGIDTRFMTAGDLSQWLHRSEGVGGERTLIFMSRNCVQGYSGDDDSDIA